MRTCGQDTQLSELHGLVPLKLTYFVIRLLDT